MSGFVHTIATKRVFNFTNVANTETMDVPLVRGLDITDANAIDLLVRVHEEDVAAGSIQVVAEAVSLTMEEPDTDFVGEALASVTVASAPALLLKNLTKPFGAMVRVLVRGTGGAGNTSATLSIDLVVRDN